MKQSKISPVILAGDIITVIAIPWKSQRESLSVQWHSSIILFNQYLHSMSVHFGLTIINSCSWWTRTKASWCLVDLIPGQNFQESHCSWSTWYFQISTFCGLSPGVSTISVLFWILQYITSYPFFIGLLNSSLSVSKIDICVIKGCIYLLTPFRNSRRILLWCIVTLLFAINSKA